MLAAHTNHATNLCNCSIGEALIDAIDELINQGRIEPQLAMKILANFDKAVAETLGQNVKSRLNFKVGRWRAMVEFAS